MEQIDDEDLDRSLDNGGDPMTPIKKSVTVLITRSSREESLNISEGDTSVRWSQV